MKPQLELGIERDMKGNKKSFCCCVGGQRLNKENTQLLVNKAAGLCLTSWLVPQHKVPVTMDPGREEALAASASPAWGRMVWTGALLRSFLTGIILAACDCFKTA